MDKSWKPDLLFGVLVLFSGCQSTPATLATQPDPSDWSTFATALPAAPRRAPPVLPTDPEHEPESEYLEGWQEWHDERAYPRDILNEQSYDDAHRHKQGMHLAAPGINWNPWEFMGPTNLDHYQQHGEGQPPLGGRTNAVAWDPVDPAVMYAASACGGVWKTTDGGASWLPLTDDWSELYTNAIAIDPQDRFDVFVGTGDFPGRRGGGIGLMISNNGGATWHKAATSLFDDKYISDVVIDPDDPDIIVACTGRTGGLTRVYRSDDDGQTFLPVILDDLDWCDLAIGAPFIALGSNRYYYAIGVSSDGASYAFYRSDDRGLTWTSKPLPVLIDPNFPLKALGVTASPFYYRNVYVYSPSTREVFRSDDAGDSWTDITGDLDMDPIHWTQPFYSFRIHCFTHQDGSGNVWDALFLANNDVVLAPFANGQWVSLGGPTYSANARIHVDVHNFATDPSDGNRHLVTSDGGIYGWTYDDDTFYPLNEHYGTHLVNTLATHPTDIEWMMGGTQDDGTPSSLGDRANWDVLQPGDTGFSAISQVAGNLQFIGEAAQLGRDGDDDVFIDWTDDGWATQQELTTNVGADKMRHGTPIAIGFDHPNLLYFASNYLYRFDGALGTWTQRLGDQKLSTDSYVQTFAVARSDGDFIYTGSKDGELWMTDDGGQTWERIDDGVLPDSSYADISIDPQDPRSVLVGFRGSWTDDKLFQCADTTAANRVWKLVEGAGQDALPGFPVNAIARHPMSPKKHWFVGTDVGVYGTRDGGQTWIDMTTGLGLPNVYVTDLSVVRNGNVSYLFASTYGRGIWRLRLEPVAGEILKFGCRWCFPPTFGPG